MKAQLGDIQKQKDTSKFMKGSDGVVKSSLDEPRKAPTFCPFENSTGQVLQNSSANEHYGPTNPTCWPITANLMFHQTSPGYHRSRLPPYRTLPFQSWRCYANDEVAAAQASGPIHDIEQDRLPAPRIVGPFIMAKDLQNSFVFMDHSHSLFELSKRSVKSCTIQF
jgi:hypothetical protein